MERKGVVGASECNLWHKPGEPLEDLVDVLCHYENGMELVSCKFDGKFVSEEHFGKVLYWMHIPPLPEDHANEQGL